jgi:UDP-N-acetyl-D-glucosamine/UDP-N-acetyl-D-galactosamine dehydrogenase
VIRELESYGVTVQVHEPVAAAEEALHEYGVVVKSWDELTPADAIVAAVSHKEFMDRPLPDLLKKLKPNGVFTDVKSAFDLAALKAAGAQVWRL